MSEKKVVINKRKCPKCKSEPHFAQDTLESTKRRCGCYKCNFYTREYPSTDAALREWNRIVKKGNLPNDFRVTAKPVEGASTGVSP